MSQGNGKLAAGWRTAKLGDLIVEAATGFACGQRANDGAIQLRMNNVTRRGELDWSSFIRVPIERAMLDDYGLRAGDVVFNNTNSTEMVGKTALFNNFKEPVVFSNHFTRLRTKPDALAPDFLALWLHAQWQAGLFARICDRWIGQSAVQRNKLLALEIPLPPLEEQRRIAARLRDQLSISADARAALEAQLAAAESLPAAHLRAVFESEEAKRWPRRPLSECVELLAARSISTAGDVEVCTITTACLNEFGFDPAGVKSARMQRDDVGPSTISPGEILIARSNTAELVGRVAMYSGEVDGVVASDLLIRLLCRADNDGKFLTRFLSNLYLTGFWRERASGASGTMKKITRSHLHSLLIPAPPLAEQRAIATRLDAEFSAANALRVAISAKLAELGKLPAALLREAFSPRGEVD